MATMQITAAIHMAPRLMRRNWPTVTLSLHLLIPPQATYGTYTCTQKSFQHTLRNHTGLPKAARSRTDPGPLVF
ncbi:hypothetical protein BD769DRAFT_226652 [Suillus cothurnatus]|nr:hypothetical protein BD769DRAFT_226652 [Suillus cothurnatus]